MLKLLNKIRSIPITDYPLLFRIYFLLYLSKWYIEQRHLKDILSWIETNLVQQEQQWYQQNWRYIRRVAAYTNALSKYVLFESKCYDKALTVKKILNEQHIPSILHFGVAKSENTSLKAHAWIICGEWNVIGGRVARDYTSVRTFS